MRLRRLSVAGVRNLASQTLHPGPRANLVVGPNGSGKTSLLEAIYLLARGRSFRARSIEALVTFGAVRCTVYGELEGAAGEPDARGPRHIGVSRETAGGFCYRVDGEAVSAASVLADALPLVLINSNSFSLLDGSPKDRRRFLDWGVFHTSPGARPLWRQQHRALQQRNALLRDLRLDRRQLALWDAHFATAAEDMATLRSDYVAQLSPIAARLLSALAPGLGELKLGFHPGWDRSRPLVEILKGSRDRDIMQGGTQFGPHRADLKIKLNGRPAAEVLSRGQAKMLAVALLLAQGAHFRQSVGRPCVNLVDDLPAELDQDHRRGVARLIAENGGQCFVTGTDADQLLDAWKGAELSVAMKMFHVEQGLLTEKFPASAHHRERS
ncbi:MAG: DNA replication/repair protein RecF [Pseudomonadota bacterium]|jgi:DNA replication and repair protein RecF